MTAGGLPSRRVVSALPRRGRHRERRPLAVLGIALTTIYAASVIVRADRRFARLGPDSILAVGLFLVGIVGLTAIAEH